jgi:hypothetical protein
MSVDRDYLVPKTDYLIRKGDIPSYFNETAMAQMEMWEDFRLFGFPHGGGYDDEPALYIDIIKALEVEYSKRNKVG